MTIPLCDGLGLELNNKNEKKTKYDKDRMKDKKDDSSKREDNKQPEQPPPEPTPKEAYAPPPKVKHSKPN